jgi:hypothetical protein
MFTVCHGWGTLSLFVLARRQNPLSFITFHLRSPMPLIKGEKYPDDIATSRQSATDLVHSDFL